MDSAPWGVIDATLIVSESRCCTGPHGTAPPSWGTGRHVAKPCWAWVRYVAVAPHRAGGQGAPGCGQDTGSTGHTQARRALGVQSRTGCAPGQAQAGRAGAGGTPPRTPLDRDVMRYVHPVRVTKPIWAR
jgi:hypothetical protein